MKKSFIFKCILISSFVISVLIGWKVSCAQSEVAVTARLSEIAFIPDAKNSPQCALLKPLKYSYFPGAQNMTPVAGSPYSKIWQINRKEPDRSARHKPGAKLYYVDQVFLSSLPSLITLHGTFDYTTSSNTGNWIYFLKRSDTNCTGKFISAASI